MFWNVALGGTTLRNTDHIFFLQKTETNCVYCTKGTVKGSNFNLEGTSHGEGLHLLKVRRCDTFWEILATSKTRAAADHAHQRPRHVCTWWRINMLWFKLRAMNATWGFLTVLGLLCRTEARCSPTSYYKNCWIRRFPGIFIDVEESERRGAQLLKHYQEESALKCSRTCCLTRNCELFCWVFFYITIQNNHKQQIKSTFAINFTFSLAVSCSLAIFHYDTSQDNVNCFHLHCPTLESCVLSHRVNVVLYNITKVKCPKA